MWCCGNVSVGSYLVFAGFYSLLVDDQRHSALAMLSLAAVQPHGVGVVNHDGEGGDHALSLAGVDGLEA